jgi:hypothetical protein
MELKAVKLQLPDDLGNDLLADVSISNLMQEATSKLMSDIYEKFILMMVVSKENE